MSRTRLRLRVGAIVFALLSVALHALVWNAGRGARSRQADVDDAPPVPLPLVARVVSAAPAVPVSTVAPVAVPAAPATPQVTPTIARQARRAPSVKPGERRAAGAVRRAKREAKPAQAAKHEARRTAPAWNRPLALPEFDDSLDPGIAFAREVETPRTAGENAAPVAVAPERTAPETASFAPAAHDARQAPVPAEALPVVPARGSVRYRVHYGDPADGNVVATVEQQYEIGRESYRLSSEARASGLASWFYRGALVQQSSGRVSPIGLQPEHYRERRGEREAKETVLDVDAERVRFASGAEGALPRGAQDRLSVFVQLGLLLRADPARFAPGATVELPVLASSRIASAAWRVLGTETVVTGEAAFAAVRLRREPADDEEPAIDLWLALEPRVLPVRVRVTESSGRALDQIVVVDDR